MKMRCENCYGTLAEMLGAKDKKILELQAHVNQLHEAIRKIDFEYDRTQDPDMSLAVLAAMKLLDATPAQSLIEHDALIMNDICREVLELRVKSHKFELESRANYAAMHSIEDKRIALQGKIEILHEALNHISHCDDSYASLLAYNALKVTQ